MGLRFRKSVTLCKGVRLNFGKSGMSVTTGTKGFHNTYNLRTGKTTTSVGISGTGISYVTTSGNNNRRQNSTASTQQNSQVVNNYYTNNYHNADPLTDKDESHNTDEQNTSRQENMIFLQGQKQNSNILSTDRLKEIHFSSDAVIDWTDMLIQDKPSSLCTDNVFWNYCHEKAYDVLNGDIDTYLQVIQDIGPFDDLLEYGFGFECGTDDPNIMVVEFGIKLDNIMPSRLS